MFWGFIQKKKNTTAIGRMFQFQKCASISQPNSKGFFVHRIKEGQADTSRNLLRGSWPSKGK